MTRLTSRSVSGIPGGIASHDRELMKTVGGSLIDIAKLASGYNGNLSAAFKGHRCKVIPITSGKGIIDGFSEAVASILSHIGLNSDVSKAPDVGGFAQACRESSMVFAADDNVFIGINLRSRAISLNHDATGRAYSAALEIRAGGLEGKPVALIGAGRVGASAAAYLCRKGAQVFTYDIVREKVQALAQTYSSNLYSCSSMSECLGMANLVLLAAPGMGLIKGGMAKGKIFSVPAIPVGLTKAAFRELGENSLIHDSLEMGVATMAADLVQK